MSFTPENPISKDMDDAPTQVKLAREKEKPTKKYKT